MDVYTLAAIICLACIAIGILLRKAEIKEDRQIAKKKMSLHALEKRQAEGWREHRKQELAYRREMQRIGVNVLEIRR